MKLNEFRCPNWVADEIDRLVTDWRLPPIFFVPKYVINPEVLGAPPFFSRLFGDDSELEETIRLAAPCIEWCRENCLSTWRWDAAIRCFFFVNDQDALLFKLKFE